MNIFKLFVVLVFLSGCTLGMNRADVPTSPPKLEKADFDALSITGNFEQTDEAVTFLWPTEKKDKETGEFLPMTYQEQVEIRSAITLNLDEYNANNIYKTIEAEINSRYEAIGNELKDNFVAQKCYSFCDPIADFLCDPNDETYSDFDDWIIGQDPAQQTEIDSCKDIRARQKNLKTEKKAEIAEKVTPLEEKAGIAAFQMFKAIGDHNNFSSKLTRLGFSYDGLNVSVKVTYGNLQFSTEKDAKLPITNVSLDPVDGYLNFDMPAFDVDGDETLFGHFSFALELTDKGDSVAVGGSFELHYLDGRPTRIGRFAVNGKVGPYVP